MLLAFFLLEVVLRRRGEGVLAGVVALDLAITTLLDLVVALALDLVALDFFFGEVVVFFLGDEALVDFCRRLGGLGVVLEDPSLNATAAAAAPG